MEANTKQQQLLFDKGITNVPSDVLCSDNTLAESVGMVYDDGEHRVIQAPKEFITSAVDSNGASMDIPTILYVHKLNSQERFIASRVIGNNSFVLWGEVVGTQFRMKRYINYKNGSPVIYNATMKFSSIGNTLIIANNSEVFYFLYKSTAYENIGNIPEPKIKFWLESDTKYNKFASEDSQYIVKSGASSEGIFNHLLLPEYRPSNQEEFNDLIVGLYSKNKRMIKDKGGFCEPFFIRYALRLYDGTYTHISNPILMFPCVTMNSYGTAYNDDEHSNLYLHTKYSKLFYSFDSNGLDNFRDILDGVDIFISDSISPYTTDADQNGTVINDIHGSTFGDYNVADGVFSETGDSQLSKFYQTTIAYDPNLDTRLAYTDPLAKKKASDIINEIKAKSVFYKICDIGLMGGSGDMSDKFERNVLVNLTTQEILDYDDYYSRCTLYPNNIFSYNSRLNLANVERGFFEGFDFFMPLDGKEDVYNIWVTIKTDYGNVVIKHTTPSTKQLLGYYFYYPDSRATNVVIKESTGSVVLNAKLTEHPGLNGAYYFAGLPGTTMPIRDKSGGGSSTVTELQSEMLPNYIIQSEVNNPWVFKAEGYFKVGTGNIIGMSSITQALSEGQFGQFPLLVFSESGIWALSVADTGYYSSIHPMSREVCNNAKSITQTDGAVFFTSAKGLMVVVGNQVKCVSDQLSGKDDAWAFSKWQSGDLGGFQNFFKACYIAYDYRDSLLWIMGNSKAPVMSLIYSIKTGTFGMYKWNSPTTSTVNYYPDSLIQDYNGTVYSLLERPQLSKDYITGTTNMKQYTPWMVTRPMKLEDATALKSIMHIENISQFSSYTQKDQAGHDVYLKGYLTLRIFASNNLDSWVEITSLRGTPWKYYRFRFDFTNLIATDRFAGTIVVTQERRTDKIR